MFRLLLIAVFMTFASFGFAQRTNTVWIGQSEDWFDSKNWTNGVPNFETNGNIANGQVFATGFPGIGGPSAGNLVIGSSGNGGSQATLEVIDTSLDVLGTLEVARSNGDDVVAQLFTLPGGIRRSGDVTVGEAIGIGIANPGLTTVGHASANALAHIGGNLLARDGTSPSLTVGVLNGSGWVFSDLVVENSIGSKSEGFSHVAIGTVGQAASGDVTAQVMTQDLFGNGESTLHIGSNFGRGVVEAGLHVNDGLHGFQFAQIGNGNAQGVGIGTLSVGGFLDVERVEVGNRTGTGRGRLDFLPGSTFQGSSLTVHSQSHVTLPSFATGRIFNDGRLNIADESKVPSIAKIEGDFIQSENGVTVFDVRNFDPELGYESIEIGGLADIDGRFDIRFADDFKPELGELHFVRANGIKSTASVRLINPPKELAVLPIFEDGFRLEIVEPQPLEFQNPGDKGLTWLDRGLWGGTLPQAFNQIKLINDEAFPQSIVATNGVAQSLVLGGKGGMNLIVPAGEEFAVTHDLTVEAGSSVALRDAKLIASNLILNRGASLENASGSVLGNVINSGIVEVGAAELPELQIDGDFSQAASGLIQLDLLGKDRFDKVVVDGVADLDGKLFINVPEDLDLSEGIRLPLIEAADGIKGKLDIHLFGPKLRDVNFQFKQDEEGVTLFTISADFATLGDMNADGVKDATDILAFSMALTDVSEYLNDDISNGVHPLFPGDLNFDGSLDLDDIEPFLDCIESEICLPEFAEIPEPSSIQLALFALGGLVVLRRRERNEKEVR